MIPKTVLPEKKGGDGDPLDAIVLGEKKTMGTIVQVNVLVVLYMTDLGENDQKIINFFYTDYKKIVLLF